MSAAKDRVLKQIEELNGDESIETLKIARELNLSRSVVSHYLNQLVKENKVQKIQDRPVKWRKITASSEKHAAFADFIGGQGSLKKIVEQVSAAAIYPPAGLNVLLTGKSGTGKSFLAKKIFAYAKEVSAIGPAAPYIVLNCASYANNPELISSMLFGHVKGAYTGADADKDGLLKKANGGYLFLDEVHRLSSENQEKLFSFIDSGLFYKMGDNVQPDKSNVRLVMATTEVPEQV
ncbi:AAA family ATPase, partial [Lactobacillus sp. XV13L]|nr:AAA family ATPase [Lactobacillus sp. XV13L]